MRTSRAMKKGERSAVALRTLRSAGNDRSVRSAAFSFLLTRALVFLIFILVTNVTLDFPERIIVRDPVETRVTLNGSSVARLRRIAGYAGSGWYLNIALEGYDHVPFDATHEHNWAFLPLFPFVWWLAAKLTGGYLLTGMALSNLFFFFALLLLHKTVLAFGYDAMIADRAAFYTA